MRRLAAMAFLGWPLPRAPGRRKYKRYGCTGAVPAPLPRRSGNTPANITLITLSSTPLHPQHFSSISSHLASVTPQVVQRTRSGLAFAKIRKLSQTTALIRPSPPESPFRFLYTHLSTSHARACALVYPSRQPLLLLLTPKCRSPSPTLLRVRVRTPPPTTPPRRLERTRTTGRTTPWFARKPAFRRSHLSRASCRCCSGYLS